VTGWLGREDSNLRIRIAIGMRHPARRDGALPRCPWGRSSTWSPPSPGPLCSMPSTGSGRSTSPRVSWHVSHNSLAGLQKRPQASGTLTSSHHSFRFSHFVDAHNFGRSGRRFQTCRDHDTPRGHRDLHQFTHSDRDTRKVARPQNGKLNRARVGACAAGPSAVAGPLLVWNESDAWYPRIGTEHRTERALPPDSSV
jgi:hypothetical protein